MFMAVVKANAYGHGAIEVSKTAEAAGADFLGVASLGEAIEIRSALIKLPILVLSEVPIEYVERLINAQITPTVYTYELASAISDIAHQKNVKVNVHIKIDTGMGRVGIGYKEATDLAKKISSLPNIVIEGIFTHFSTADDLENNFINDQFEKFLSVIEELKAVGIDPAIKHCANSAATIFFPKTHLDMVRIGIAMYGLPPVSKTNEPIDLLPVLSFKTKVLYLKDVPANTPLSYGAAYVTKDQTRIVTLPVGYADGLSRALSNRGIVMINGKKYPIVGKVTMDMILVDTGHDKIEKGAEAVIIGEQHGQKITADDIAGLDETINYEVVAGIGKRVPRVYI